jgi:hypothetical protein
VLVRVPLMPPEPLAVVELASGYGRDTVGLDSAVSVLLVPDTGSVPLEPNEVAVGAGSPEELVSVKGAGLKDKGELLIVILPGIEVVGNPPGELLPVIVELDIGYGVDTPVPDTGRDPLTPEIVPVGPAGTVPFVSGYGPELEPGTSDDSVPPVEYPVPVGINVLPLPVLAGNVSLGPPVEFEAGYGAEVDGRGGTVNGFGEPAG